MKRYYFLLAVLCAIAVVAGIDARRVSVITQSPNHAATVQPTPQPTAMYRWGEIEIEPFLYALPLGTFTPDAPALIYELPYSTQAVGELPSGDAAEFTSEYRHDGDVWLCVKWSVDETIASWNCTGWVLAESAEDSHGTIDREYEFEPTDTGKGQAWRTNRRIVRSV